MEKAQTLFFFSHLQVALLSLHGLHCTKAFKTGEYYDYKQNPCQPSYVLMLYSVRVSKPCFLVPLF